MKVAAIILLSAFALAQCDDRELYSNGCPVDYDVHKVLPHDTYCNLFYSCVGGNLVELYCPGELVFNKNEEVCDWRTNVDCAGKGIKETGDGEGGGAETNSGGNSDPSAAPQICALENSDGVLVAHENCDQFYKCYKGVPVALECPAGLHYNYNFDYCDWPNNVECGDRVIPSDDGEGGGAETNPGGNSDPSAAPQICAQEDSDGVLVAHENCDQFYKCYKAVPVALECPAGLLYNYNFNYCDWPNNVECGDRVIPSAE